MSVNEVIIGTENYLWFNHPDSKAHGANVGPTWGRQDPGGTHVGHMYFTISGQYQAFIETSND